MTHPAFFDNIIITIDGYSDKNDYKIIYYYRYHGNSLIQNMRTM